jgi:hypothetical protein
MFKNPLQSHEGKEAVKELGQHNKEQKLKGKNEQRKRDLAKKIATKKNPERGHEERLHKRMMAEGDRNENDYR